MHEGTIFTAADVRSAARVAVVGETVVANLLPGLDPVGQTIRVRSLPFHVVGVLAAKGQSLIGQDQDDLVVMPYTTVQKKLLGQKIPRVSQEMVSTISANATTLAVARSGACCDSAIASRQGAGRLPDPKRHGHRPDRRADRSLIMTLLLGSIAGISLVVGGIGIMNIMLVSVTERTREIGIRMAVGARGSDISRQFLVESVLLSLAGGLVGVVVGSVLTLVIARVLGWPQVVSATAAVVSFGFAALVGVFFGYYPAHKAASLDPIDALRYE